MTYVLCPNCDEGMIEVEVGRDSEGDAGVIGGTNWFFTAEITSEECGHPACDRGCPVAQDQEPAVLDKAIENAQYYSWAD